MAYTTTALFKTFRGISGAGDDALIATLITAAQAQIDTYTGRTFEGSAANRTFDAIADVEGRTLWVFGAGDLASITTVTNGDASSTAVTSYVTEPRNAVADGTPIIGITIKASASQYWQWSTDPEDAITVNGVWAWSATAPGDVIEATNLLVAHWYDARLSTDGDLVVVPGTSVTISRGMPATVRAVIDHYKVRS